MNEVKSKIYTRRGDDGSTSLVGGNRISKGDLRLECYGTIDELNAVLGRTVNLLAPSNELSALRRQLVTIQNELFNLGSRLACTDAELLKSLPPIQDSHITQLEQWIDEMNLTLPALKNFILPGGALAACDLHLARTVARRAERSMVRLHEEEALAPELIRYVNRLSDYFFVSSRWCNLNLQMPETLWQK